MDSKASPPVKAFLPAAFLMTVLGWGGLAAVILYTSPSGGSRWLLFFTGILGISGAALIPIAFLNRRFPSVPPPENIVIVRQALCVGVFFATLAWFQLGRVLSLAVTLLLAIGLALIEWLLRMRERSQWKPD